MVKKLSHMDIFEFQEAFPDDISEWISKRIKRNSEVKLTPQTNSL
jgi:hypothetical protein